MNKKVRDLAQPFPPKYVHTNPSGGGSYVKHHVITQRLIQVLGEPPSFEVVEIIRGDVAGYKTSGGKEYPDLTNVIVGVVARLTVDESHGFERPRYEEEAGDCEQPHNWKTDGQRLKDAMSDAYKRCAMRLGCGLHLWSQDEFFLFDQLSVAGSADAPSGQAEPQPEGVTPNTSSGSSPDSSPGEVPPASQPVTESPSASASPGETLSEDERLEHEDLLARLKEWVGGNDKKHNRVRAEVAKASLEANIPPPELVANATLSVLRSVASVLLTKENA